MAPGSIFRLLCDHARLSLAILPFLAAAAVRLLAGKSRATELLVTLATLWFAINVLLTPFSSALQSEISALRQALR